MFYVSLQFFFSSSLDKNTEHIYANFVKLFENWSIFRFKKMKITWNKRKNDRPNERKIVTLEKNKRNEISVAVMLLNENNIHTH